MELYGMKINTGISLFGLRQIRHFRSITMIASCLREMKF